jgi:hypothetical protein
MISSFPYRSDIRYAIGQDGSPFGDGVDRGRRDELDAEAAEIRRMIELSGMIGLECRVLDDA